MTLESDMNALKTALKTIDAVPMSTIPHNMKQMVLEKKCEMYRNITDKLIETIEKMIPDDRDEKN